MVAAWSDLTRPDRWSEYWLPWRELKLYRPAAQRSRIFFSDARLTHYCRWNQRKRTGEYHGTAGKGRDATWTSNMESGLVQLHEVLI